MGRILAWVLNRLLYLFPGVALLGGVFVYISWADLVHMREVAANGVEATARIEGGTRTRQRRSGTESTKLNLSWRDAKGSARTAYDVTISGVFTDQIARSGMIVIDTVRIKYLPDAMDSAPIILDDAANREETAETLLTLGVGMVGGGVAGSSIMLLVPRRRRRTAVRA